jgi:hypothetical protein
MYAAGACMQNNLVVEVISNDFECGLGSMPAL